MDYLEVIDELFQARAIQKGIKGFAASVLDLLTRYFGFNKVALELISEDYSHLSVVGSKGLSEKFMSLLGNKLGSGISGKVALTGELRLINDIRKDEDMVPFVEFFKDEGISSCLYIPAKTVMDTIGVLDIYEERVNRFDREVIDKVMKVLGLAAYFLSFIRDLETANNRLKVLEILNAESTKISSFYQSIMESVPIGIVATDMKGYVVLMNKVLEGMSLHSRENCLGKKWYQLFGFYGEIREKLLSTFRTSKKCYFPRVDLPLKDGSVLPVEMTTDLVRDQFDNTVGVVAICSNIEEKKKIEQEVERIERLITIGKLAAGISHEIRNPLAGISGVMQVLKSKIGKDPELMGIIDRVCGEIGRLDRVIERLNGISSQNKMRLALYNVTSIIEDSLFFIERALKQRGISLVKRFRADIPKLIVDRDGIYQVVLNIMINAMNAMQEGGELRVETDLVDDARVLGSDIVWHDGSNGLSLPKKLIRTPYVNVIISDSGIGISKSICPRIFEPFFTTSKSGSGLGLYVSAKIIDQHNGMIGVRTEKGKGSTFYILLPVKRND